jgi:hypothetical protein
VHIIREGREVAIDEDEPGAGSGKHALGEANRSGLRHFAIACGADELEINLFTSPDLRECHLIGTEEERRFMAGTYHRICMPEAEFLLSNETVDHLTEDPEVASIRAIMLARAARRRHGHVETEMQEQVSVLEKAKVDLETESKVLKGQVGSLEATIVKNKDLVDDAQALLGHNLDLHADLKKLDGKLKEAEDSRKKAEEAQKKAEELAEKNAKKLEDSHAALLACMQEVKVALDAVFAKGGAEPSEVLPDADPAVFSARLQAKLGQFTQLLNNVSDFGAYGAALAVARSPEETRAHQPQLSQR